MAALHEKISRMQRVYFSNWGDTLTWLLLASLLLWVIAKAFGWINTPKPIEFYPYIGVILFAFALFQRFITLEMKVVTIGQDLHEFKGQMHIDLKEIRNELRQHGNRLVRIEAKLA